MPWEELPCREFCNAYKLGCNKGRCRNPYDRDDPRRWLGRGQESVAGQSFGWAHNMERDAIRAHLRRRIWKFGLDGMAAARLEFRVAAIQTRLQRDYHRRKPPIGVRRKRGASPDIKPTFTAEELRHLADLFANANDPVSRAIAEKASRLLTFGQLDPDVS